MSEDYLNMPIQDYSSHMIAGYIFDDSNSNYVNGNTVYDLSGNGYNMTTYNVTYDEKDSEMGRCAYFNGTNAYGTASINFPLGDKSIIVEWKNFTSGDGYIFISGDSGTYGIDFWTSNNVQSYNYAFSLRSATSIINKNFDYLNKKQNILITYNGEILNGSTTNNYCKLAATNSYSNWTEKYNSMTYFGSCNHIHSYFKGYIKKIFFYDTILQFSDNSYLIKDNNKIYSLKSYSKDNGYTEITDTLSKDIFYNQGIANPSELITETIKDEETFIPKTKFTNPQLVSYIPKTLQVNGIKSTGELVVSKQSLSTVTATTIHKFLLDANISGDANILTVVSDDNGVTWKYYKNETWNTLTNAIPNKLYGDLSDEEKNQWDNAKNEIISNNSMTPIELENADFEAIRNDSTQKFRFAYVIQQANMNSKSQLKAIKINEDKKGLYAKIPDSDIKTEIGPGIVQLTPLNSNCENVLINIELSSQDKK